MLEKLSLFVLLSFLLSPSMVLSEQKFKAKKITSKAIISETAVSNSGSSLATVFDAKKGKEVLQYVDVKTAKALATFSYSELNVDHLSPIAVNDSGVILAIGGIGDFDNPEDVSIVCSVFKIDAFSRATEVLETLDIGTGSQCRARLFVDDGGQISGALNEGGDIFLVYDDDEEDTRVYRHIRGSETTTILSQEFQDFGNSLPPVYVSEDGELRSFVSSADETPAQLLFYTSESGLSLHPLPEELHFRPIIDFAGEYYLFFNESFNVFGGSISYEMYIYKLDSTRSSGTLTLTGSSEIIRGLRKRNKEILLRSGVSAYKITPTGEIFGNVDGFKTKNGESISYSQIFLHGARGTNLLTKNTPRLPGKTKKQRFKKLVYVTEVNDDGNLFAFVLKKFGNGKVFQLRPAQ